MKTRVLLAAVSLAFLAAGPALAADLGVAPQSITMTITTGDSGSSMLVGNVNNPPPFPLSIVVQLRSAGGSLPASWLVTPPISFLGRSANLLLPLTVRVPAAAAPGLYTAFIQPFVLSANLPVAPPARPLQLSVTVLGRCSGPPAVAAVSALPAEFKAPNGRLEDVSVAGRVTVPPGCGLRRAWYTLSDEYGVLGETRDVTVAADGSFGFSAAVQVSRRGDDKDGRAYQFTVYAADETGTGASAPATVVVRHDQRKDQ